MNKIFRIKTENTVQAIAYSEVAAIKASLEGENFTVLISLKSGTEFDTAMSPDQLESFLKTWDSAL